MPLYQDAEKFINNQFWPHTHDSRSKLDIEKIVGDQLVADNEEKDPDYFNRREGVVHVSSISKCLRGVVLEMLKAEKDKEIDRRTLGVFKAGNLFEDFIISALGKRVVHQQREYRYEYKGLVVVGRSDFTIDDDGVMRVGENKSVHSDSFWHREKEGTLVAWHNQVQLQIYMWFERILNGNEWDGIFSYVSKDDVTIKSAPVKFNQAIIDEVVIPALDIIADAYAKKDAKLVPIPAPVVYVESKHQFQKNWLATYCDYHNQCAGEGWLLEATAEVTRRNKEMKESINNLVHMQPKPKKVIVAVDAGSPAGDKTTVVVAQQDEAGIISIVSTDTVAPGAETPAVVIDVP